MPRITSKFSISNIIRSTFVSTSLTVMAHDMNIQSTTKESPTGVDSHKDTDYRFKDNSNHGENKSTCKDMWILDQIKKGKTDGKPQLYCENNIPKINLGPSRYYI